MAAPSSALASLRLPWLGLAAALLACPAPRTPVSSPPVSEPRPQTPPAAQPPVAPVDPAQVELHGQVRTDEYAWMRDRDDPRTREYLEAENAYAESWLAPTSELRKALFDEILGHIVEDDVGVPVPDGPFVYYARTEKGRQYTIHCRRPRDRADDPSAEEILVDENVLAQGHTYFELATADTSPDHRLLALATDTVGDERYRIRVLDTKTGTWLPDELAETSGSIEWAQDGRTLLYVELDDAHRPWRVRTHVLGQSPDKDRIVFEEPDERFYVGISKSRSDALLVISSDSQITSEVWLLDAKRPTKKPRVVMPRRQGIEYWVSHQGKTLYVMTNEDALEFRIDTMPLARLGPEHAKPWRAHDPEVRIEGVSSFRDFVVVSRRRRGLPELEVVPSDGSPSHLIPVDEPVYDLWLGQNLEFDTKVLRLGYRSMVTPYTVLEYDPAARTRKTLKVTPVNEYDPARYASERVEATGKDGTKIPVSLVYRTPLSRDGTRPMLLTGYGAYGATSDPAFSSSRLALLDRGFVFAIAHVRGGGDLGRAWYEAGKLEHKQNTFDDFIASAEHLVAQGYTAPEHLAIRGASAGGLLMGAVVNQRPDLFGAVVADVPFVDVVGTMLDATLPLTPTEWEEWGDPREPEAYERLAAYSPYDNVRDAQYPAMMVVAGWSDPRVGYWEPAKWVARLRTHQQGEEPLLLLTDMEVGHGGATGRYGWIEEVARWQAFVITALGVP